jgi:hypothetical protein
MGFQLDEAYVDLILREQTATDNLNKFHKNVVRQSQEAAKEGGNAFRTLMFGRMGSDMKGVENIAARAFGPLGKMFLRGGVLGIGLMEGIHGLKAFGEEMITGGDRARKMTEEVSKLRDEVSKLALETTQAAESTADLHERQMKLLTGKMSGESALEKLTGKLLDPKVKKELEDILRLQDKAEKEADKRREKLEGEKGLSEKGKREHYDAEIGAREQRIKEDPERYRGELAAITHQQMMAQFRETQAGAAWFDKDIWTPKSSIFGAQLPAAASIEADARRRVLAKRMYGTDISNNQKEIGSIGIDRKQLTAIIEKLPEAKQGRQQLSSVEEFGNKILEMGGGEKAGASEELQKQTLDELKKIATALNGDLGDGGGARAGH